MFCVAASVLALEGFPIAAGAVSFFDPATSLGLTSADLVTTVINIINWALGLLAIIAVALIIYGGYYWLTAAGNEERITKAKKIILNTVIGLVIILLAWAIVNFIIQTTSNVSNGDGGSTCVDGEQTACADCINGEWQENLNKSTCQLPQDVFEIRSITTSCSDNATYNENVFLCSAVNVNFNQNVKTDNLRTLVETTDAIALKVEQCGDANCSTTSQPSPLFNDPAPTIAYSGSAPTGTKAEFVALGKSVSFVHAHQLFPQDTYFKLTIPVSIKGISGKTISACKGANGVPVPGCELNDSNTAYEWIFRVGTETDTTPPKPVSSYPQFNQTKPDYPDRNVNRVPIITLTMDEPIAPWTLTPDNITITAVTGSVNEDGTGGNLGSAIAATNYTITGNDQGTGFLLAFHNGFQLDAFTWYEISVNNLQDLCSNIQSPAPLIWRFETNGVGPGISQFYPSDGFQYACPNTEVFVQFNTSMYDVTTGTCSVIYGNPDAGGFVTGGTLSPLTGRNPLNVDPSDAPPETGDFNPNNYCHKYSWVPTSSQLASNTNYSANVTTRYVMDENGGTLEGAWAFKTSQPGNCANAPYISGVSLPNGQSTGQAGMCMTVIGGYFDGAPPPGKGPNDSLTFAKPNNGGEETAIARAWTDPNIVTNAPDMSIATYPYTSALKVTVDYQGAIGKLSSAPSPAAQFTYGKAGTYEGPCLYVLDPSNGYRGDTFSFSGDHFNTDSTKQIVHFGATTSCTRTKKTDPACWATDTEGQTKVPSAAALNVYSPVSVENDAGRSNELSYYVTSGEFQVQSYVPSCGNNVSCTNAAVQATFTSEVSAPTVKDTTVTLYSCSLTDCPSNATLTKITLPSDLTVHGTQVVLTPGAGLAPGTSYRVIVQGGDAGVQSADDKLLGGLNYDNDGNSSVDSFTWTFGTTSTASACELDRVQCQPPTGTVQLDSGLSYYSEAFSAPDACSADGEPLNANDFTWQWSAEPVDPQYASVAPTGPAPYTTATGTIVTPEGVSATIKSSVPDKNKTASCTLRVTAKEFTVTEHYPSCGGNVACTNSDVWVTFNEGLSDFSATSAKIELFQCQEKNCLRDSLTKVQATPTYAEGGFIVYFPPYEGFQPGTWYRAVIHGGTDGVHSIRDEPLSNVNFDFDGDNAPDSYSWTFGTAPTADACAVDRVNCSPETVALSTGGSLHTASLTASAFSAGNACDTDGTELNANDYPWRWSSADEAKVTVAPDEPQPLTTATGIAETTSPVFVTDAIGGDYDYMIKASCSATVGNSSSTCRTDADCVNNPNAPYTGENSCPGSQCVDNQCTPVIKNVQPGSGAIGSWITVSGCYFGSYNAAQSKAVFLQETGAADDIVAQFPPADICGGSTWADNQIILEVPNRQTEATSDDVNTQGPVQVVTNAAHNVTSTQQFDPHGSVGPNLCLVAPTGGQAGTANVALTGEYFDDPPTGDPETFYSKHSVSFFNNQNVAGNSSIWKSDSSLVDVPVPVYATDNTNDGEITVSTPKGTSNPIAFSVLPYGCSVCSVDSQCSGDGVTQGCGAQDGSYRCCADRPKLSATSVLPVNPPLTCRNAQISATFHSAVDQAREIDMDKTSINHTTVILEKHAGAIWTAVSLNDGQFSFPSPSQLVVHPGILDRNTEYRVTVKGDANISDGIATGVLSFSKVGMNGDFQWTFTTQDTASVCALDHLVLIDPSYTFTAIGGGDDITALTYDNTGQLITPIPGVYDWTWQWSSADAGVATVTSSNAATQTITPAQNGSTAVTAKAKAGIGWTGERSASAPVTVQTCLSPWPNPIPYADTAGSLATQFSTWYCRDQLGATDLQSLTATQGDGSPVTGNDTDDLIRQFFFEYPVKNDTTHKTDAIGVLVYENENRLSPAGWYKKKFGTGGNSATSTVDGYQAIRIGTSTYVAGTNLNGPELYTNIYVLGYNDDAQADVVNIFNQMMKNFHLNFNENSFAYEAVDATTALQRVRVDTRRVADLKDYQTNLVDYSRITGTFPQLTAGSYIETLSTSAWPSWTQTFGAELQSRLSGNVASSVDPVNTFSPTCSAPYDAATCWDDKDKWFKCENGSHIYAYQRTSDSRQYDLYANLEYEGTGNWRTGEVDPCQGHAGSVCRCFDYSLQGVAGEEEGRGDTAPPSIPGKVKATAISDSQIDINWLPSIDAGESGMHSYTVYRSYTGNPGTFADVGVVAHDGSENYTFQDAGLLSGTSYYYQVSASDYAGNDSAPSGTTSARTF